MAVFEGGGFDVVPADLKVGAANLAGDSLDVGSAGVAGSGAVAAAGGACGGGPLAGALSALSSVVGERASAMAGAAGAAGSTMDGNRCVYVDADAAAAQGLGGR